MKRLISTNFLAAALALGAFSAASAAHAGSNLYFSVGVQGVPAYYPQPAPVYVQPAPVYVQPRAFYVQPRPVYEAPRPLYVQPLVYSAPAGVYLGHGQQSYQYWADEERARRRAWRRWYWTHHHHDHDRDHWRGRNWD